MSLQATAFPYERRTSATLGVIHRPVAQVELYSSLFNRWLTYTMVVDTGADYCVFPASIALDLGLPLTAGRRQTASGIGGLQRVFLHQRVHLRLGLWDLWVPAGFIEQEKLPPLLGRYRCLDRFDLRLHRFVTTFGK